MQYRYNRFIPHPHAIEEPSPDRATPNRKLNPSPPPIDNIRVILSSSAYSTVSKQQNMRPSLSSTDPSQLPTMQPADNRFKAQPKAVAPFSPPRADSFPQAQSQAARLSEIYQRIQSFKSKEVLIDKTSEIVSQHQKRITELEAGQVAKDKLLRRLRGLEQELTQARTGRSSQNRTGRPDYARTKQWPDSRPERRDPVQQHLQEIDWVTREQKRVGEKMLQSRCQDHQEEIAQLRSRLAQEAARSAHLQKQLFKARQGNQLSKRILQKVDEGLAGLAGEQKLLRERYDSLGYSVTGVGERLMCFRQLVRQLKEDCASR